MLVKLTGVVATERSWNTGSMRLRQCPLRSSTGERRLSRWIQDQAEDQITDSMNNSRPSESSMTRLIVLSGEEEQSKWGQKKKSNRLGLQDGALALPNRRHIRQEPTWYSFRTPITLHSTAFLSRSYATTATPQSSTSRNTTSTTTQRHYALATGGDNSRRDCDPQDAWSASTTHRASNSKGCKRELCKSN